MEEIKKIIKDKIEVCLSAITDKNSAYNISVASVASVAAEAVEHLSRAYCNLCQIKESEV